MVLSPTRLPRSSPLSYMQALPSGWDDLHLTEKWAQKTGSGTCLIYMESCSEVTRKNEMNKCKRQSAFLRPSRHFSFNDFKFEYSRPLVLPKNAARSQQKKKLYAKTQPVLSRNYSRNWAFPNYFLSRLPHSAGAAETSVSVSVKNFLISWKYTISVLLNLGGLRSKLLNS